MVTLTAGQIYNVAMAVEDGQGEAGLVANIALPREGLQIVDPSNPLQADWCDYGLPNQDTLNPRAAVIYRPREDMALKLLAGRAFRAPNVYELYYQTSILGRRDLEFAPDPRTGFQMTLVRMLAFRPAGGAPIAASSAGLTRQRR